MYAQTSLSRSQIQFKTLPVRPRKAGSNHTLLGNPNDKMPILRNRAIQSPKLGSSAASSNKAFARMMKHAEKMRFERSGLLPESAQVYVQLKNWYKESSENHKKRIMEQNILDVNTAMTQGRELARVFGGKTIGDGNVGVLGFPTVWARHWTGTEEHPIAPWPSSRELREEGDERHTSNYGRYLPIPRVPGNKTVVYKQKSWTVVEDMDAIMPVPKLYGLVNPNMFGFEEIEVDEAGVPFDDNSLPGNEHIIKRDERAAEELRKANMVNTQQVSGKSPGDQMRHEIVDFDVDFVFEQNPNLQDPGNINGGATPFIPRNIRALNSEHLIVSHAFKDIELDPATFITPDRKSAIRPEVIGFTDPFKATSAFRPRLRIDTNVPRVSSYGSQAVSPKDSTVFGTPEQGPHFKSFMNLSPGAAFRMINPQHVGGQIEHLENTTSPETIFSNGDVIDSATTASNLGDVDSPLGFKKPKSFSLDSKPRLNRPNPLKLKVRRRAIIIEQVESDSDDEYEGDGGVKLN